MAWGQGKFGWGTFSGKTPQFNVKDQEVLGNIQASLLEPNDGGLTWPSGMWTQEIALDHLQTVQDRFLSESGIAVAVVYQAVPANQRRVNLPDDCVDIRRVAFANEGTPSTYVELPRADAWELDHGTTGTWPSDTAQVPQVYMEDHLPSLTIEVSPAATDDGEIELTETTLSTPPDGSGIFMSVPDDFTPYLAWGARGGMLASEGEANDPMRAKHCYDRFSEGVELARILVSGGA